MSFDAGSVIATLSGRFNPAAFAQFDGAMKKSAATMEASEKRIATSTQRANAATSLMGTNAGKAATVMRAGWLAVGAGAAIGLAKSVSVAMKFETQMSELKAVTKASAREMNTMKAAALDLGAKTGVGATQAAKGLTELSKGGLSAKQATEALVGTIALAQAGDMDLAEAANTVVQSMSTFNLKAKDSSMIVDGLASAANKTTMDVADFAQAFAQGGAAAQNAGLSFDETLNVMGTMANKFKSGSDMGTSLKTTLAQLAHPTKQAKEEMKRLNIDLFDSHGRFLKASELTKQLGDRFAEMTPKQRTATAAIIAGTDGMRTLIALANAPKGDGGNIREIGAGADVAKTKMDNLAGSWKHVEANLQNIGIDLGTKLIPKLKDASDAAVEFMQQMQKHEGAGGVFDDVLSGAGKFLKLNLSLPKAFLSDVTSLGKALGLIKNDKKEIKITAKVRDEATEALNNIENKKLKSKIVHILGDDSSARHKAYELEKLGISGPTAHFLADTGSVGAARAALLAQGPVLVPVLFKPMGKPSSLPDPAPLGKTPHRASGRGPGAAEAALVGEGTGAELVGNQRDGFQRVDRPTFMGLGPDDWVLPVEQYPATALGLVLEMLGLKGYKKGKKARKARPHARHVDPIAYAEYLGPLESKVQQAQALVTRDESAKDEKSKKGKLTKTALKARAKLPAERRRLKAAKAELASAKTYGNRISKFEDLANIYADDMTRADNADDGKAYNAARLKRENALGNEQRLLVRALNAAGGDKATSAWARALRKKIGETDISISETAKASPNDDAASESTFTGDEQKRLDKIESDIALAALTDTKTDDIAAEQAMVDFLTPLLAQVQASGGAGRGGPTALTDIAGDLKGARDALKDLTRTPDLTADQQAIQAQSDQRALVAAHVASTDKLAAAVIQGAGLGAGPTLVLQSYVPPSPSEARRLADHVVGGVDFQGGRPASKERIGV